MNSFRVADLPDGKFFSNALYLDNKFLLLDKVMPFTNNLRKALVAWDFKEVLSDDKVQPPEQKQPINLKEFENVNLEDVIEENAAPKGELHIKLFVDDATKKSTSLPENERVELAKKVYNEFSNYINEVFTRYVTHRELLYKQIYEAVLSLSNFIKLNEQYILLKVQNPDYKLDKNFIINHSIRCVIYALTIGQHLKMPEDKLVDLGITSVLHEIGQIKLPPQLYITDRMLSKPERIKLSTHPILGYNILKENNFPLSIQLGVLEHHESENGKGYPRRLMGQRISLYGKILFAVCSFESITAPRHYKEQRSVYDAMIEMLRNNDKQYEDIVIKALVQALSLFPIGAYVYLSNGKIAKVVAANSSDPRTPVVQMISDKGLDGTGIKVQTDNKIIKIVRVLTQNELNDILRTLGQ